MKTQQTKDWSDMTKKEQAANVQAHYDKASKANKAQHSPLPRLTEAEAKENMTGAYITLADGRTQYCEHLSERERRAVNHADKLAEALKDATEWIYRNHSLALNDGAKAIWTKSGQTLAAYEDAQ